MLWAAAACGVVTRSHTKALLLSWLRVAGRMVPIRWASAESDSFFIHNGHYQLLLKISNLQQQVLQLLFLAILIIKIYLSVENNFMLFFQV